MKKSPASAARGFTLVETVMASVFLTLLVLLAMATTMNISSIIAAQERTMRTDQQAQRVFSTITRELGGGLLPVNVADSGSTGNTIFEDIDRATSGFGGTNGTRWRTALTNGVDNVAFCSLIDARRVGDYNDGNNHLQLGQNRMGIPYIGASARFATVTRDDGSTERNLFIRNDTTDEPVNVLALLNPNTLSNPSFEIIESPTQAEWAGANGSDGWQAITAFMAIRFVPLVDNSGSPVILSEADVVTWPQFVKGNVNVIDLDGNGQFNDSFQIGKLQLLYSGGNLPIVDTSSPTHNVVYETVNQMTMNLTSYCVLRDTNAANRVPIFQFASTSNPGDSAAGVDPSLLRVRLLLLDRTEVEVDNADVTVRAQQFTNALDLQARWYETFVSLSNMNR